MCEYVFRTALCLAMVTVIGVYIYTILKDHEAEDKKIVNELKVMIEEAVEQAIEALGSNSSLIEDIPEENLDVEQLNETEIDFISTEHLASDLELVSDNWKRQPHSQRQETQAITCLLYTSDAADD